MKTAVATLKSAAPYSQSRFHNTPKQEKENAEDYRERTWRDHCHTTRDGHVFIPPMAFKNCLAEAAKFLSIQIPGKGKSTYTKHFEAGVLVFDPLVLPITKSDVDGETLFLPSDGVRGSGKRVLKRYPIIHEWAGDVTFHVADDTITKEPFKYILTQAGQFIGIGRFRPRNCGWYGRFTVEKIRWSEDS
ncbi:MAG TPA: hypothetical protein VM487_18090 [Phycisphaerae bacterium]|nr:hypothetical protein [Phycisphaerae bacterium]